MKKNKRKKERKDDPDKEITLTQEQLRELFDGIDEVRDHLAVLVLALKGQNVEYDYIICDQLQRYGVRALEKQMGVIEKLAGVEEGLWWD